MVNRIMLLLKAKNITSKQFAEEIGIQPSGMSHILSGRNNPSLDFVMKLVSRYPEVDIRWLILGTGEMYVRQALYPSVNKDGVTRTVSAPSSSAPTERTLPMSGASPKTSVDTLFDLDSLNASAEPQVVGGAESNSPVVAPVMSQYMDAHSQDSLFPKTGVSNGNATANLSNGIGQDNGDLDSTLDNGDLFNRNNTAVHEPVVGNVTNGGALDLFSGVKEPILATQTPISSQQVYSAVNIDNEKRVSDPLPERIVDDNTSSENRKNDVAKTVADEKPILPKQKKIVKLIALYDDKTFSEYFPE